MHLFAAQPGGFVDDEGIIDLAQTPANIVILSAADSSLSALAKGVDQCLLRVSKHSQPDHPLANNFPSIRLANWMHLVKPAAFDLYQDKVLDHADIVVLSLLGGQGYWEYGFEQLQTWSRIKNKTLIVVPGDDTVDEALFNASTVSRDEAITVWRYLRESGSHNSEQLFYYLANNFFYKNKEQHSQSTLPASEPYTLPRCMVYMPKALIGNEQQTDSKTLQSSLIQWKQRWASTPEKNANPVCLLLFYRSHLQSANTTMFDELIACLEDQGINPLPMAISSLKEPDVLSQLNYAIGESQARLIINTTGFASNRVGAPGLSSESHLFDSPFEKNIPVLQLILSSSTQDDWQSYSQGLRSRDIAMQVVLPEMDGRIITRAISFKSESHYNEHCETSVVSYQLHQERGAWVAQLAKNYCRLSNKTNSEKRIAMILANYPTKDGRIGNGVGLDTPASSINILRAMQDAGFPLDNVPENGDALIKELLGAVTNNPNTLNHLPCWQSMDIEEYLEYFYQLPQECQTAVWERWGAPNKDPKCRNNRMMLAGIRLGETFVGIQPARGFDRDLLANYHDPDLVPPHSYLAFYFWLRHCYKVDAIIHVGKHGNLEWLPGKGTALSESCWPDIAMGPTPHFYPFIVNDPGEGAQAKRRTQAVIIDHLMPPMSRAEIYGDLADLEALVDEYYQALGLDVRRENWLREQILNQLRTSDVLQELGIVGEKSDNDDDILNQLDAYLCDIKEAQIRHGLHILGELPNIEKQVDTMVALLRLPRGTQPQDMGILHALAQDFNLRNGDEIFDPLAVDNPLWLGNKPTLLNDISPRPWRTQADTRERLELLSQQWVSDYVINPISNCTLQTLEIRYPAAAALLTYAKNKLLLVLQESVDLETRSLVGGLQGEFVPPGSSGAPTRGRLDTLPTGRNFYSVDNRAIPSTAAWALGQQSAQALIERHLQEEGDYPKHLGLSVWGTSTMRTGGDDIAQAFALMGVKPIWAAGSLRVVDFEIIPTMLMGRPRVDVTLRVSGFFRDAFPNVMRLFDAAVLAIAKLEEPGNGNVIKKNVLARQAALIEQGFDKEAAFAEASYRVFGSKPGAYGAGLQGLIDERCWENDSDLAEAYVSWGGYAYGRSNDENGGDGVEAKGAFEHQLSKLEVVVQNQDNREHDLLDSDDYYQFQGGMSNAVNVYKGEMPAIYHGDHSNPSAPKIRTLKEELNRVIRSRVLNPKWINAMQTHGYKGAFEMAASVDYLFAYDATTHLIDDYQYKKVAQALVFDKDNQAFLQEHNAAALEEMAERLLEATQRGMWQADDEDKLALQDLLLEIDEDREKSAPSS